MIIKNLKLKNFRNIKDLSIDFNEGVNFIVGQNAQGKTNILESIYLCSIAKSYKNATENQIIKFGEKSCNIDLSYLKNDVLNKVNFSFFQDKKKIIKQNGLLVSKSKDVVGNFQSVLFTPDHLNMIKQGPIQRRNFIDMALCEIEPSYTLALLEYQKILKQRNKLLKEIVKNENLIKTIDVWDIKLCQNAGYIMQKRSEYLKKLNFYAKDIQKTFSKDKEKIKILYLNQLSREDLNANEYESLMYQKLKAGIDKDIINGATLIGPHKDDLFIIINGKSAKHFASQGQIRSIILSMKLSEAAIIKEKFGVLPVILFDDVLSELDSLRRRYIFDNNLFKQCIITCCNRVKKNENYTYFKIKNGELI